VNIKRYGRLLAGARGLLIYEAIERALAKRIDEIYAAAGRPRDASIARYHWETWQLHSGQEAAHETLAAILPPARGGKALAEVRARQGTHGARDSGASYGLDPAGVPYYTYPKSSGGKYYLSERAFGDFLAESKKSSPDVVKREFKVTEKSDVPQGREVDRQQRGEIAGRFADLWKDDGGRVFEHPDSDAVARGSVGGGEEDDGTEDEAGLAHFLETGRLKPEVVRAMLDRFQPGEEDLKREVQAILDEYENKKKQK
jgi:hypothetical protein